MEILQVEAPLVCTRRVKGLQHISLRILRDATGKRVVAVDPVGARRGNWVFTSSGSAARYAAGDYGVLTDLTICGIIDFWDEGEAPATVDQKQQ
ncbi:MAG: carboxysome shell protein [Gammaproteobacteria bacterium SG8_47]|nr:MAG: carboxysome shell protein [Gammaproteobacteria bacterium SG8_47]